MVRFRRWLGWAAVAVLPLLTLLAWRARLLPDPIWANPTSHFFIVSLTAMVAMGLAALMMLAAGQLRDARVFFLALAFLSLAGIFLVHALTTPGALIEYENPWVGFSAYFSLFSAAVCLALSTVDWPAGAQRRIVARQGLILGLFTLLLVGYATLAVATSASESNYVEEPAVVGSSSATSSSTSGANGYGDAGGYGGYGEAGRDDQHGGHDEHYEYRGPFSFLADSLLSWLVAACTLGLLALVIARYARLYRLARLPSVAGFLASALLLAQAQLAMVLAPTWHASWWQYHVALLLALGTAFAGLSIEYAQSGDLQGVVEGLLLRDTIARLQRGYTDVIVALVGAVEAKDPYTRGHTQRVAELAVRIGQELRLSPERLRVLAQAAMLHDIGKIGVPDSILNKPGPLTEEEFAVIRDHPTRGHAIIKGVRSLQRVVGGVRHHHERLDGSGYPDGLAGEAIPLEARIIAVADVYDALTSARSYRTAWSPEQALATIDEEAGAKLDSHCVAALHRVLRARAVTDSRPTLVEAELVAGRR